MSLSSLLAIIRGWGRGRGRGGKGADPGQAGRPRARNSRAPLESHCGTPARKMDGTVQLRGQNFEERSLPCSRLPVPSQRSRVRVGPVSKRSKSPREVRAACVVQSGVGAAFACSPHSFELFARDYTSLQRRFPFIIFRPGTHRQRWDTRTRSSNSCQRNQHGRTGYAGRRHRADAAIDGRSTERGLLAAEAELKGAYECIEALIRHDSVSR
jgi:hypothetical protein